MNWVPEFGDPSDPTYFDYLYSYSPLHNVDANKVYPFTYIQTQDVDERVPPLHSFKMIAELQRRRKHNANPLLMYYFTGSGHRVSLASRSTQIELATTKHCVASQGMGLTAR